MREKWENWNGKNDQLNRDVRVAWIWGYQDASGEFAGRKKKLLTERVEDPHWSRAGSVFEALTGSGVGAIPALLLLSVPHSRALCQLPPRGKHSQAREAGGG